MKQKYSYTEMEKETATLIARFHVLNGIGGTGEKWQKSQEGMEILKKLYELMQEEVFFEVLFSQDFRCDGKYWTLASPLLPLLQGISVFSYSDEPWDFSVKEKEWIGGETCLDNSVESSLLLKLKDEEEFFLRTNSVFLKKHPEEYKSAVLEVLRHKKRKSSSLFVVFDGTFTESVCLVKDGEQRFFLVSSALNNSKQPSHIHSETSRLSEELGIPIIPCKGMQVRHDGNCTIQSEFNVNALLYESWRQGSVFKTLMALKEGELDLIQFQVFPQELIPHVIQQDSIDSSTLARWISAAGLFFGSLYARGWFEFCKNRQFHPLFAVKLNSKELPCEYPAFIWEKYGSFPCELHKLEKESTAGKEIIKFLSSTQEKEITELISKLDKEVKSCWPYRHKERKELKIKALEALIAYTKEEPLAEAIAKIKTLYPEALLGKFSRRTAELLERLEKEDPTPRAGGKW